MKNFIMFNLQLSKSRQRVQDNKDRPLHIQPRVDLQDDQLQRHQQDQADFKTTPG